MSYNGSGTFNINTAGQPVVTGSVISSTAFNALTADLATGLSTAITKDGQTTVTGNIPLNGFKLTGIGAPTISGDALSYGSALGTPASGVATNLTGTASGLTAGAANAINSATTTVNTNSATAPSTGQVLTATSSSTATWQTPSIRKNAIINGDFNVWQRGTSFNSAANGAYTADRFGYGKSGAMVHDISRSTDVPTVAEAGRLFNYSALIDCTTVDASIAAGDFAMLSQVVEGYNFLPLAQRTITLSFWVKATKTGIYCVSFRNAGFDRSYVAEYTVNATATWEKKTITITASPSAGTWNYTNEAGVWLGFCLAAGSTYQTTASAWQTGSFLATANQVNACDSTSNDFRLCGVQLEAGSNATDFEQLLFGDELALCERYYSTATVVMDAAVNGTTTVKQMTWLYVVPMRTTPTLTVTGTNGSPTVSASDNKTLQAYSTATTTFMGFTYAASAEL